MKKILVLGGSFSQIPLIKYAKSKGYYVITCDYLPNNPGHVFADEYHNISTVDKEAILILAKRLNINAVIEFASDENAISAAFLTYHLKLPGNSIKSVNILSKKDLFRSLLQRLNLPKPKSIIVSRINQLEGLLTEFSFPLILKPVDSSGSSGVFKVHNIADINLRFKESKSYSYSGKLIIEEFIKGDFKQVHGDAYIHDGKIISLCLGDHHFKNLVPYATTLPSTLPDTYMEDIENDIQKIVTAIGFTEGGINLEARIQNGKVYIIDIAARCGGHNIPKLIESATKFSAVKHKLNFALGLKSVFNQSYPIKGYHSMLVIHSEKSGILKGVSFSEELKKNLMDYYLYQEIGEAVKPFVSAKHAIGVLLVKNSSHEQMIDMVKNHMEHINVILE